MESLLNGINQDTLYVSLENLFGVKKEIIEYYVVRHLFLLKDQHPSNIDLPHFLNFLSDKTKQVVMIPDFESVAISHLTTRVTGENLEKEPVYNLFDALTENTEMKYHLERVGLTFFKAGGKLRTLFRGNLVDWKSFLNGSEYPTAQMIINRFEGNRFSSADKCVNGFLFGGKIYENGNVRHILYLPEIVENMLRVLGEQKAINELTKVFKPYMISFAAPIGKIIFDGSKKLTVKQTRFRIIRYCLHYLSKQYCRSWSEHDNPIIRLIDDYSVQADQIISVQKIDP
ncbi:hypothetical protein SD70_24905 [Gordoniibacillus kamchatkensis]|uniref:Uncharacterized protein n=1 Tax=Gordoniibacillus kamchatkensis TaxID=1590651 RepID=A0ABR5ACK1_9BACL|nr:hypothetical protein [Paenibacillus sp. VKM B-2647]KIL38690.1 hypothetical protein SD70_24905 [Paenibacillus sp. VKM B-2647]